MIAKRMLAVIGFAAAVSLAGMGGASSAVVSLLSTSTQGAGNQAHVYGAGYDGTTPSGATWSQDPLVTPPPGNLSGIYQSPFNNTPLLGTQTYFSVGAVDADGDGATSPVTLAFGSLQTSLTILWGSIDSYNTLAFLDNIGGTIASFTGTNIVNLFGLGGSAPNYEQVALLNFDLTQDGGFWGVRFISTQAAFEFALAQSVPLPAAGWLLLTGLAVIGACACRTRR